MIWKVVEVEQEDHKKDRTFMRVHAWSGASDAGLPEIVSDFLLNLDVDAQRPVRNGKGLVKLKTGQWVFPVREVNGEWEPVDENLLELETYKIDPVLLAENYIVPVLVRQFQAGRILDVFGTDDMPKKKAKAQRRATHTANVIEQKLKGKRREVSGRIRRQR